VLRAARVEELTDGLARTAGEALASVPAEAIDAIVMASAARRGDAVITSDPDDLRALSDHFRSVRVVPL
jgi:hypothetical protein